MIGCKWRGPIHENKEHEESCVHPKKTGADVMLALKERDEKHLEETKLFTTLLDLLNYEKIIFNGELPKINLGVSWRLYIYLSKMKFL